MRLLNTGTGHFEEFQDNSKLPHYAILSHTWSPEGEQTYQDVRKVQEAYKPGAVQREMPSPASLLLATQQDILPSIIVSDEVTPVSAVEAILGGNLDSMKGLSTVGIARA